MNIQHYQPQVMKGAKITAQSFNDELDNVKQIADSLNIETSQAQIGFSAMQKRSWFRPKPEYKYVLDAQAGTYKLQLDKLAFESIILQNGDVDEDQSPKFIAVQQQVYAREDLEALDDPTQTYVVLLLKKKTPTEEKWDFFQPEMDELDEDETIEKAWMICTFKCDIEHNELHFVDNYIDGIDLFNGEGGQSDISLDLSSLNWVQTSSEVSGEIVWQDTNIAQNWNYSSPKDDDKVEIAALSDLNDYRFLARPEEDGTLKYASLSSILSTLSSEISGGGGGGCSCDLTAYLTSGTKIADWTKDGVNIVEIYAPSGGGPGPEPEVSATTLSGNTLSSEKIGPGDLVFEAMASCNISVETTGTTIKLGVYYI